MLRCVSTIEARWPANYYSNFSGSNVVDQKPYPSFKVADLTTEINSRPKVSKTDLPISLALSRHRQPARFLPEALARLTAERLDDPTDPLIHVKR